MKKYEVIVVGGGHAGIEASLAAARMGCPTLLLTMDLETIGFMSCNPAIGGVGKGQLVKEVDALGGEMGRATDKTGIQFRILNSSKGPAVHSSRAQVDREAYRLYMKGVVEKQSNLWVKEAEVERLIVEDGLIRGVVISKRTRHPQGVRLQKEEILGETVIISPGTFLDGLIHIGLEHFSGGRIGEPAARVLAEDLKARGFNLLRFKTGTCPRLDKRTIDFSRLTTQEGDSPAKPFSFSTKEITQRQVACFIAYTNEKTHKIIRDNLAQSPLYTGIIKARGVRYCPSLEDKVVKFADKTRHQIFLEPEGYTTDQVYPNGLSTSLPEEVQFKMLHSIEGLEEVKVIRFGYGIEHTVVDSTQIYPTLETKLIKNLYLAGQINGTTGYEEAAAQGLIAGINAGLRVKKREPLILDRALCYIGVLIDDLTTRGTDEPYRMFTSRVEYRLLLREDNADLRLRKIGYDLGLVSKEDYLKTQKKQKAIKEGIELLSSRRIRPTERINFQLKSLGTAPIKKTISLEEILKRPELNLEKLDQLNHLGLDIPLSARQQIEMEVKYSDFIQREFREVERFKNLEKIKLPADLDYVNIPGLSREIREKLSRFKPLTLGQASRISGVTPVAISLLMIYLRKLNGKR